MKTTTILVLILLGCFLLVSPVDANGDNWVPIDGVVSHRGLPVCAMLLANGQHQFTCSGDGSYSLSVPPDGNGNITLYCFAAGFAPYKQVMTPGEAVGKTILMDRAVKNGRTMSVTSHTATSDREGWVTLSGTVVYNDAPLCAMILANGQNTFTCSDPGNFRLDVPLDDNGDITLYGFASGFQPYQEIRSGKEPETPLLALTQGGFWEFGWTEYESSYAMSDTSYSLETGYYRATLGTAENIGGILMYALEISGHPGDYTPRWERIGGDSAGRIFGTEAGSRQLVTLYDPSSGGQWPGAGFFVELRDTVLMKGALHSSVNQGKWHTSHQYYDGSAHAVTYSFEQDNCEYFPGIGNICGGDMDQDVLEIEYWTQDLGPVAWHYYTSYSDCGGSFCSGSTSEYDVGLYRSSLMGDTSDYLLETGPTSYADPMTYPNTEGLPSLVVGRVKETDPEDYGIHDWYEIILTEETAFLAELRWISTDADLDLYFIGLTGESQWSLETLASSTSSTYGSGNAASPTKEEVSGVVSAGTYYLGVVAYDAGSLGADYDLVYVDMPN